MVGSAILDLLHQGPAMYTIDLTWTAQVIDFGDFVFIILQDDEVFLL